MDDMLMQQLRQLLHSTEAKLPFAKSAKIREAG